MKEKLGTELLKDLSQVYPELLVTSPMMKLDNSIFKKIVSRYSLYPNSSKESAFQCYYLLGSSIEARFFDNKMLGETYH
jgi:hypothetical protein|tara:strand:- start:366 stop:602 length:237 start_codon:yes stop_codon:yes gene_type:complete